MGMDRWYCSSIAGERSISSPSYGISSATASSRLARAAGASCKFCGSGGAVVGTYTDEAMLAKLKGTMEEAGCTLIVPEVVGAE